MFKKWIVCKKSRCSFHLTLLYLLSLKSFHYSVKKQVADWIIKFQYCRLRPPPRDQLGPWCVPTARRTVFRLKVALEVVLTLTTRGPRRCQKWRQLWMKSSRTCPRITSMPTRVGSTQKLQCLDRCPESVDHIAIQANHEFWKKPNNARAVIGCEKPMLLTHTK